MTVSPFEIHCRTKFDPMKPAPPVTRKLFELSVEVGSTHSYDEVQFRVMLLILQLPRRRTFLVRSTIEAAWFLQRGAQVRNDEHPEDTQRGSLLERKPARIVAIRLAGYLRGRFCKLSCLASKIAHVPRVTSAEGGILNENVCFRFLIFACFINN